MAAITEGFAGVAEAASVRAALAQPGRPCVLRGLGAHWPAVQHWHFDALAQLVSDDPSSDGYLGRSPGGIRAGLGVARRSARLGQQPVQLVAGNRERHTTRFATRTLGEYLHSLGQPVQDGAVPLYLKEFDLLKALPVLRQDLRPGELWPRRGIVSSSTWVGPAQARTGLHHDLLDNLAMLVTGAKRFYLAPPGSVEQAGAVSDKHDRWAVLARLGIDELATRLRGRHTLYRVDLAPGDALYVPHGWWHEVVNLQASILLSGFFGSSPRVLGLWAWTGAKQLLHQAGGWRRGHCTCHGA